jgi:hypothetical protein
MHPKNQRVTSYHHCDFITRPQGQILINAASRDKRAGGKLTQLNRLAVPEKVNAGGWCHSRDVFGECLRRQINQIRTLRKADGPPGTPVHGDDTIWLNIADHVGSLFGVEMTMAKRGSPASDWHQGDVDVRHFVKGKVRTCVPRIPAPA